MTPALEIKDLSYGYDPKDPVLRIENLAIPQGERVFLYGPSGSGKTTLLSLLAGIIGADSGRVAILGRDMTTMRAHHRDKFRAETIGYIFQQYNLIPYLTVTENITLPVQIGRKFKGGGSLETEVKRLAEALRIDRLLDKRAGEISIGQAQRVAAARALIGSPEIVLADEPTSALDSDARELFLKLIFGAMSSTETLLFVSHDHRLKDRFSRSVNLLEVNTINLKTEAVDDLVIKS